MMELLAIWTESKFQQELEIAKRNKKISKKFLANHMVLGRGVPVISVHNFQNNRHLCTSE